MFPKKAIFLSGFIRNALWYIFDAYSFPVRTSFCVHSKHHIIRRSPPPRVACRKFGPRVWKRETISQYQDAKIWKNSSRCFRIGSESNYLGRSATKQDTKNLMIYKVINGYEAKWAVGGQISKSIVEQGRIQQEGREVEADYPRTPWRWETGMPGWEGRAKQLASGVTI